MSDRAKEVFADKIARLGIPPLVWAIADQARRGTGSPASAQLVGHAAVGIAGASGSVPNLVTHRDNLSESLRAKSKYATICKH
jgi:hypothetical protein